MHVSDLQLEVTSMYCQVVSRDATPPDQLSSRLHHWNTLLYVGLFTAKVFSCLYTQTLSINSVVTKALDAETETKTEAVYLKTEAEAQGSWPTVCGKKQYPLKFFASFLETARNFYTKFDLFITRS